MSFAATAEAVPSHNHSDNNTIVPNNYDQFWRSLAITPL